MSLPDLTLYRQHREAFDAVVEGIQVPGLHAVYYSRPEAARVATVGVYRYDGVELFMAWGYADEAHCRWTAYRRPDGSWTPPRRGCPRVRVKPGTLHLPALNLHLLLLPPPYRVDHELWGVDTPSTGTLSS